MSNKSIKIWVWWNCTWTRLKIGEKGARLYFSCPTDEGWHSEEEVYWLEDGLVYSERTSDGRDCDGRLCVTTVSKKPAINDPLEWETIIRKEPNWVPDGFTYRQAGDKEVKEERPVILHEWEREHSEQYDEYAEAAGY